MFIVCFLHIRVFVLCFAWPFESEVIIVPSSRETEAYKDSGIFPKVTQLIGVKTGKQKSVVSTKA